MDAEKKRFVVPIAPGVEVDLTDLPPLTLGDKQALRVAGVDFRQFTQPGGLDPEAEGAVALHILRKRRGETTLAEVFDLPAITVGRIIRYAMERSTEVADPFLTRSTSSAELTGGASAS